MSLNHSLSSDLQGDMKWPIISRNYFVSDADIVFKSSDGILFHIHSKNLESHAGGFPPSEFHKNGEIVPLTEDSGTLKYLFQHIYPQRHPDLDILHFEELFRLAEAAEKYEVYSLMNICKFHLKQQVSDHPTEMFNYASRHDYRDILALAAPFLLDIPLDEVVAMLLPHLVVPWIRYRERWSLVAYKSIRSYFEHRHHYSDHYMQDVHKAWYELGDKRSEKAIYKALETPKLCTSCRHTYPTVDSVLRPALQTIPKFDTFL